jgi:hypothetical protein
MAWELKAFIVVDDDLVMGEDGRDPREVAEEAADLINELQSGVTVSLEDGPAEETCQHDDWHREGKFNVCDECGATREPKRSEP